MAYLGPLHPDDPVLKAIQSFPPKAEGLFGWIVWLFGKDTQKSIQHSVETVTREYRGRRYLMSFAYLIKNTRA